MPGSDTASQVPSRFDVVVDGHGYVLWNGLMQSLPFRNQRAAYSWSPIFLERTNVSGKYGDNEQDFFLTVSQNDWSEGDGQRFFRGNDADRSRRFWAGHSIDPVTVPGQVTLARNIKTITPAADVVASCPIPGTPSADAHAITTTTTLYFVKSDGTITSQGAHSAGTPRAWGMTRDTAKSPKVYIAGATKIRKYDANTTTFSDFSATADAGSLAFLNNQLYSCDGSTLKSYDTSGTASTLFTWKDAGGTALAANTDPVKLIPFGGVLLIYWASLDGRPQLWQWDGQECKVLADMPVSAVGYDCHVLDGIVFLSGVIQTRNPFAPQNADAAVGVIWEYDGGSLNEIWRAEMPATTAGPANQLTTNVALGSYAGRLLFFDASYGLLFPGLGADSAIKQYDIATGGFSTVGLVTMPTSTSGSVQFSSKVHTALLTFNGAYSGADSAYLYPDGANLAASGLLDSSVIDFDNSLKKIFRSVRVDWEGDATGSVDISYAIDQTVTSSSGSFTSLQTAAVAGTEYLLPDNTAGHEISIRLKLNAPSSGAPPSIKRVYARAAPIRQSYRRCQYVIDLTGRTDRGQESNPVVFRDGSVSTLTGAQLAANLVAAITATAPVQVSDRFGTYQAVFEQGEGTTELDEVRPDEYIAQVTLREV